MSLDNFHTLNPVPCNHPAWFPTLFHRHRNIQSALHQSNISGDWANRVPIGPIQPADPAMRISSRPDPYFTEHRDKVAQRYYVPTKPVTKRRVGDDTVESSLLYEGPCCPFRRWWTTLPLRVHGASTRYHPY